MVTVTILLLLLLLLAPPPPLLLLQLQPQPVRKTCDISECCFPEISDLAQHCRIARRQPFQTLSCIFFTVEDTAGYLLTYWLLQSVGIVTNSMELSPSCGAARCVDTLEFPNILYNTNVHYRDFESPRQAPILSQINPAHTTPSFWW
jgi:hypothetical protein